MKSLLRLRTFALLAMFIFLVFTVTSCMVMAKPGKGNNGKHKGWKKGKGNKHGQNNATPWEPVENSKV